MRFEITLDKFLLVIIFIKLVFIISTIGHLFASRSSNQRVQKMDPKLVYWKNRTEFIFTILMAFLLIYEFNPRSAPKPMTGETRLLIYLFGWILILTADWNLFITEANWYKKIVSNLQFN